METTLVWGRRNSRNGDEDEHFAIWKVVMGGNSNFIILLKELELSSIWFSKLLQPSTDKFVIKNVLETCILSRCASLVALLYVFVGVK